MPGQVAVLVSMLEQASPAERQLILRAVTPQSMAARLEHGRLALRRVIANLVDNAVFYGKAAHLSIDADSEFVTLLGAIAEQAVRAWGWRWRAARSPITVVRGAVTRAYFDA